MRNPVCATDTSGEIVDGLFFQVLGQSTEFLDDEEFQEKDIFVPATSDESYLAAARPVVQKRDERDVFGCGTDKTHQTRKLLYAISIVVENGATLPVFWSTEHFFVMSDCIEKMEKAGLRGTESIQPKFESMEYTNPRMRDGLRVMTFPGRPFFRHFKVTPPGAENCSSCGQAPVVCQSCGYINRSCPKCNQQIISIEKDLPEGSPLIRYRLDEVSVLDGSRWDGSDFLDEGIITRRALKLFQKEGIGPCVALNYPTYIGNCTPEQRGKLREMSGLPL